MAAISGTVAGAAVNFLSQTRYDAAGSLREALSGNGVRRTLTRDADGRDTGIALALPPGADTGGGSGPGSGARSENDIPLPPWAWVALALLMLATLHHQARTAPRPAASRPLAPRTLAALLIAALLAPLLPPPEALAFDTARRYDPAGNLIERTDPTGTTTYTYDRLDRLSSESGPARSQSFSLDPNGNRTADGAGTYATTPASNRYAALRGASPAYDPAGNLLEAPVGAPPRTLRFAYNQAGRLSQVFSGTTLLASYTYLASGLRARKALTAAGAQAAGLGNSPLTLVYHYDLRGQLIAETSASGTPIRSYLWHERPDGSSAPLAQIEHPANTALGGSNPASTERVVYFTVDALGTPRSARDAQGNELWRWASDAYGATA
ncbi:MAG: hypothetical protein ACK52I_00290, partial [Pseudomonadota bacterium]